MSVDTKLKGDIAEQAAVVAGLKRGWDVLLPVGDRLPYDLVFVVDGHFVLIQVKSAWYNETSRRYLTDNRMYKANRREGYHQSYKPSDFDVALCYIQDLDIFYVLPADVFCDYAGMITLEGRESQRPPRALIYREAWQEISSRGQAQVG